MKDPAIDTVDVSVFTVPTDAPESAGTTAWDSTTMVLVRIVSGVTIGMGWTYGAAAQDVRWFEEPVSSNDLDGLRDIRNSVSADVAAGEYGFDLVHFRRMCDAQAVNCLQIDDSRCGGPASTPMSLQQPPTCATLSGSTTRCGSKRCSLTAPWTRREARSPLTARPRATDWTCAAVTSNNSGCGRSPQSARSSNVPAPSGRQIELRHGEQVVVVTEVGAGLRSYMAGARPVIDGYPETQSCTGARGHSLIPWPNRVKDGKYGWDGIEHQLDLTEPAFSGAIHGLTRWASWQLLEHDRAHVSFGHILYPCPGWPWVLECRIDYSLDDTGLSVHTTATNLGEGPCPYGTGAHPYLSVGTPTIDTAHARVPGSLYLPVDAVGIPTGREPVQGTHYDLRTEELLGARKIDVAYTDLDRGPDGRARVRLHLPSGPAVALWADEGYPYLEVFTGDSLPQPERRRTGLGVEPMTCAPNAFNSGDGLLTLDPGQGHSARWGIEPYA